MGSLDETIVESSEDRPSISQEMDISSDRLETTCNNTSFEVETKIENHSESHDCSHSLKTPVVDASKANGLENEIITNGCINDDVNVSYTLTNGCLKENDERRIKEESGVESCYTFTAVNGICNGDINAGNEESDSKLINDNSVKKIGTDTSTAMQMNGDIVNGLDIENEKLENDNVKCRLDKCLDDLTSSISTLSIGDNSSSLPSDLSQMTLKDENEDDDRKRKVETPTVERKGETTNLDNVNSEEQTVCNGDLHNNVQHKSVANPSPTTKHNKLKEIQKEGQRKSVNMLAER